MSGSNQPRMLFCRSRGPPRQQKQRVPTLLPRVNWSAGTHNSCLGERMCPNQIFTRVMVASHPHFLCSAQRFSLQMCARATPPLDCTWLAPCCSFHSTRLIPLFKHEEVKRRSSCAHANTCAPQSTPTTHFSKSYVSLVSTSELQNSSRNPTNRCRFTSFAPIH